MTTYQINKQVLSEPDWSAVKESLTRELPSSRACFDDDTVIRDEIVGQLDADKDGKLTLRDLKGISATRFGQLDSILKKHGFSAGTEVGNNVDRQYSGAFDAPPFLLNNRDFILAAVKQNGMVLADAGYNMPNGDPENAVFGLPGAGANATDAVDTNVSLKDDREIVLAAVKQNGEALQYASPQFRKDREIVLAAVKQDGMAFEYADPSLQKDRAFAHEIVVLAPIAAQFADKTFLSDPDFVYAAAKENVNVLTEMWNHIKYSAKASAWNRILKESDYLKDLHIPGDSPYSFKEHLKERYDISFLERFRSVDVLTDILKTRDNPTDPNDTRPTAVLIFPKADGNEALGKYPAVDRLVELGYEVVYYEVGDEAQVERSLHEATDGGKRKADLIVLAGHGSSELMALDADDPRSGGKLSDETRYIDTSDFKYGKIDIDLPGYLSSNGDLVLASCSNGEGGIENPKNLANTIARIMPQGVQVHSSTSPMNLSNISKMDGQLKIEWTGNSLYIAKGR